MTTTLGQPLAPDTDVLAALIEQINASGRWANGGSVVQEMERVLASDLGWNHALATSSGTSALTVALLACALPAGSEVITSPLTFAATAAAIEAAGLVPVFADIDPETLTLHPAAVKAAIGPRTSALLPVHLFGLASALELDEIGREAGLAVVHDAAHAYGFRDVIGRGDATAYSLHATKLMHCGEGGLVATDNSHLAEQASLARNFGLQGELAVSQGMNAKLPELSAALALAVRAQLAGEIAARLAVRSRYAELVASSPRLRPHAVGVPRALVMEVVRCEPEDQRAILNDLAERGVVGRRFPALCEPAQRYSSVRSVGVDPKAVARLANSVIALPLHGRVTTKDIDAVAAVLSVAR